MSDDKSSINHVRADLGKWNRVSGKVERKMTYTEKSVTICKHMVRGQSSDWSDFLTIQMCCRDIGAIVLVGF